MQHSCHGLNDLKTFDILPSWQYGAILADDESGLCLDPTPCNINVITSAFVTSQHPDSLSGQSMKYAQRSLKTGRFNDTCGIAVSGFFLPNCSSDIHFLYILVHLLAGEVRLIPTDVFYFSLLSLSHHPPFSVWWRRPGALFFFIHK